MKSGNNGSGSSLRSGGFLWFVSAIDGMCVCLCGEWSWTRCWWLCWNRRGGALGLVLSVVVPDVLC